MRWNSRAPDTVVRISELDADMIEMPSQTAEVISFTLFVQMQSVKTFRSRKRFVKSLEQMVTDYYDDYAQNVKPWVPRPPTPIKVDTKNNS